MIAAVDQSQIHYEIIEVISLLDFDNTQCPHGTDVCTDCQVRSMLARAAKDALTRHKPGRTSIGDLFHGCLDAAMSEVYAAWPR